MASRLDHERAVYAAKRVLEARFPQARSIQHKDERDGGFTLEAYRSLLLGAGVMLRQCGLLQWAAFYLSKKPEHWAVLEDVFGWLRECAVTRPLTGAGDSVPALPHPINHDLLPALIARSSRALWVFEAEAQEILHWFKRVVEGLYKALDAGARNGDGAASSGNGTEAGAPGGQAGTGGGP